MTAIDISRYQRVVDFPTVAASGQVELVIAKMGGSDAGVYIDPMWATNRDGARRVGLPLGSYFFNGPGDTPTQAADFQFAKMDWRPGDKAMIDVEGRGIAYTPAQAVEWASRMMSHGVPAGSLLAYMSESVENSQDWSALVRLGVELDVASYGWNTGQPGTRPQLVHWKSWALWQYTSNGQIPGISGRVDMSLVAPTWASLNITSLTAPPRPKENPMIGIRFQTSNPVAILHDFLIMPNGTVRHFDHAGNGDALNKFYAAGGLVLDYNDPSPDGSPYGTVAYWMGTLTGITVNPTAAGDWSWAPPAVTLTDAQLATIAASVKVPPVDLTTVLAAVAAVGTELTTLDASSASYHTDLAATLAKGFTITGTVK